MECTYFATKTRRHKVFSGAATRRVIYLIAGILIVCELIVGIACRKAEKGGPPTTGVRANAGAVRRLGSFKSIEGTTYLMAPIHSGSESESFLSSGSYNYDIHNYVFFNTADESTYVLLPTNDYLITTALSFPEKKPVDKEAPVVQWLLYFLVKSDTNNDKKLDYKDKRTLAVTDAGGRGYTEIISDVEEVFGQAMPDPNTLLVIYRSDSKKQVAKIDLPRRKLVSATELPTLGYDVQ